MIVNAEYLKTEILKEYRIKKQYYICATEVNIGINIADVLLMNDKEVIEIEIKNNWNDFKADFRKDKHKFIKDYFFLKANRFYFCIPYQLKEKCLNYLDDNDYPYGLIIYNGKLRQIRKCKRLKELNNREIEYIKKQIIRRATSELIQLREFKDQFGD